MNWEIEDVISLDDVNVRSRGQGSTKLFIAGAALLGKEFPTRFFGQDFGYLLGCGVSFDEVEAKQKCFGEIVERYSAFFGASPTADTNARTKVSLSQFVRIGNKEAKAQSTEWVAGLNFDSQEEVLLPAQLCGILPRTTDCQFLPRYGNATGLAARFDRSKACLHAICEIAERHLSMKFWSGGIDSSQVARVDCREDLMEQYCLENGLKIEVFLISTEAGVGLVLAVLHCGKGECLSVGTAYGFVSKRLCRHAFSEAIMARLPENLPKTKRVLNPQTSLDHIRFAYLNGPRVLQHIESLYEGAVYSWEWVPEMVSLI